MSKPEEQTASAEVKADGVPQKVWTCKIGVLGPLGLPPGADAPMRNAVSDAFKSLTGKDAQFNFSGWGGMLEEIELAVVENRLPVPICRNCAGKGWVCENHQDRPWNSVAQHGCECGAGAPCPVCNREMACAPYVAPRPASTGDTTGLDAALILADAHLRDAEGPAPVLRELPAEALQVLRDAARDNFALSQQGGVGARYGVAPKDSGTAGVEAWFTDQAEAVEYAEDWAEPRQVWDLVLGQLVQ